MLRISAVLLLALFAGTSYAQMMGGPGAGAAPLAFTPVTGLWGNPNESGSGYNLQVQDGVLVATIYSYTNMGDPVWYIASGAMSNGGSGVMAVGNLDKFRGGQCASCMYQMPMPMGNDGGMTITFTSPTTATMQLPGGRVTQIQPEAWGGGAGPLAFTPVTGLWWNPNESGSGYNLQVQDGVLVATIYSYTNMGDPVWYIASGAMSNGGGGVMAMGNLDKFRGGQCASCMYQMPMPMGNDGGMTITFTSPTAATIQLPGGRMTQIQPEAW